MPDIHFTKMHGLGNDYVYIDCRAGVPERLPELAREMSDRHTGVGGDGIILIGTSERADCSMRILNADGSEAQMCGNGIRCVAKYVYDRGIVTANPMTVDTLGGIKTITVVTGADGRVEQATVDMGIPELRPEAVPVSYGGDAMVDVPVDTSAGTLRLTAVSMGNPHGVIFVDSLDDIDIHAVGRELETHPMWPERANIEFVHPEPDGTLTMRVWERGSGETMACGTGACATAVAAMLTGRAHDSATVRLLGGDLHIERLKNGHILMTGPATDVFTGTYRRQH